MILLKQSTAATVQLGPFVDDTDFKTPETALSIVQADVQLIKDSGAAAQKNDATTATHRYQGHYDVPLNATDTNTLGRLRVMVQKAGALAVWLDFMVMPANVWDSLFGADKLQVDVAEFGNAAGTFASGRPEVNTTHVAATAQTARDLGAQLDAAVSTRATPAQVNTEVDTALADIHLDHLLAADYDPAAKPGIATALLNELVENDAGVSRFTANALEQAPTGGSAPTAAQVADAVWDEAIADHVGAGSAGERVERLDIIASGGAGGLTNARATALDNLDVTVSSRAPEAGGNVAAIKTKTDQLVFTNANKVDAAVLAAGDFAQAAADKVWSSAARTLTSLGTSLVQEIWDRATSALTTAGSIGKQLVDNINATITSRSSHSAADVRAEMDTNSTKLANLDATVSSRATPAQVNAEVDAALDTAIPGVPTAGSVNERLKTMDDADLPGRLPAALVGGRMAANAEVVGDKTGYAIGAGGIDAASFAAGAIDAAAIAADAIGSTELAASAVAEIADGVHDEPMSGHTTAGSFGELFDGIVRGVAAAGTLSTTEMTTDLAEATNDHYNGRTLIWLTGALKGQATNITDYDGATKKLVFTAVTEAPTAGDRFQIV